MILRHILFLFMLFGAMVLTGQRAENILKVNDYPVTNFSRACDNNAGTIKLGSFAGQSDRHDINDTVFLCWQDRFFLQHDKNYNLSGDPVPSTPAGIGYAWYNQQPTVTGPALSNIEADPAAYKPSGNLVVYVDQLLGDAMFQNSFYSGTTTFNQHFNGGNPTLKYFAPITFDRRIGNRATYEGTPVAGPCVNVRTDQAFPVVYLNPIRISNIETHYSGDPTRVRLRVSGGMPEYNGSDYTNVLISVEDKPSVKATIVNGTSFGHNDYIEFVVPEFGSYQVLIRDGITCEATLTVNVQEALVPTFVLDTISGQPGDIRCVTWSVRDFKDIVYLFGAVRYDPTVLKYDAANSGALNFHNVNLGQTVGVDQVSVEWAPLNPLYQNRPDGDEFAEFCFEIIGEPGECSPVFFHYMDVVFSDYSETHPILEPGLICVEPPAGLYVKVDVCGSRTGQSDGTLTFEIFGGTGPYSYTLYESDGTTVVQTGTVLSERELVSIFDLRSPRDYILRVFDAVGGFFEVTKRIVTYDDLLDIDIINITNPRCFGESNGAITALVSGGIIFSPSDYKISWSNGQYATLNPTNLPAGTYCATVTEVVTGCKVEECVTLSTPPIELDLNVISEATCSSSTDGILQAAVTGGTVDAGVGYRFRWLTEDGDQKDEIGFTSMFDQAGQGKIWLEIRDRNGCTVNDSIEIGFLYEVTTDLDISHPLCFGDENGTISMAAQLGNYANPNFQFFPIPPFFPQPGTLNVYNNDSCVITNLGSGYYRIEITETNTGCQFIQDFILNAPQILQSTIVTQNINCQEPNSGIATVMVRGGTAPYNITSVSGLPAGQILFPTGTINYPDLAVGTYIITILDGNGCELSDTFEILGTNASLSIDSISYKAFDCVPNPKTTLEAFVTSSGGNDVFYTWFFNNNPLPVSLQKTVSNAGPGIYILEVTNSAGCRFRDTLELFEPELFAINVSYTAPECFGANGGNPGSICIAQTGGTPPFNYTWNNGSANANPCLTGLEAGTYQLTVRDVNNCTIDTSLVLTGPPPIIVDILGINGISCNNGQTQDGSVTLSASGGNNPTSSFGFLMSSGTNGFGQFHTSTGMSGGLNWALVSYNTLNGNTCFADTLYFDIDVPERIDLDYNSIVLQDPKCFGDCNGIAIVQATGGNNTFYSYNWVETGLTGAAVSGLCAGTHTVNIRDANGCSASFPVQLSHPDELIAWVDPVGTFGISCFGGNTGQIQILHQGGNLGGSFTYTWLNNVSQGPLATQLAPGFYSVTITDSKGCFAVTDTTLAEQAPILAEIPEPDPVKCFGGQTCITVDEAFGGAGSPYMFSVNNGPRNELGNCVNVPASSQEYLIEVFDKNGCSFSSYLLIDQPDPIVVELGEDIEVGLGESTVLQANIQSNLPVVSIVWTPMDGASCANANCQQLNVVPNKETLFSVLVTDINGCTGTDQVVVSVNSRRNVFVPNVFSPNGDGKNEKFQIVTGSGVSRINYFKIFDRWGNLMYNEFNLTPSPSGVGNWDGTHHGLKLNPGVFVYSIEVDFIDGRRINYRGSITLLK